MVGNSEEVSLAGVSGFILAGRRADESEARDRQFVAVRRTGMSWERSTAWARATAVAALACLCVATLATGTAGATALPVPAPVAAPERAAAEDEALAVTGQVLYGKADAAKAAAVADILAIYANNPVYMRMKAEGLSETDGKRGSKLFAEAQATTNKALAKVAREANVDVVTVPGGVKGGKRPIPDLTQKVIDKLPTYHVDGKVVYGNAANARLIAELDSAALLNAIPEWREAQKLTPNDVDYHLLRKKAQTKLEAAIKQAAGDGKFDAVVERGGVTSRLGPVADITPAAMAAVTP
jgi:molybdopterin biosynthesis enzyme MoaB